MNPEQPTLRRATLSDVAAIVALTDAAYAKYIPRIGRKPQPMTTDYRPFVNEHSVSSIVCAVSRAASCMRKRVV